MAISTAERDEHQDVLTLVEAFLADGEYMATLLSAFLRRWFKAIGRRKPLPLPTEFLLELSAVIRIAMWQRSAVIAERLPDFPPSEELLDELITRLFREPASFSCDPSSCPAPLHKQVVSWWSRNCSWSAAPLLGADILVGAIDKDALLDALAAVLWRHRDLTKKGRMNDEERTVDLSTPEYERFRD